MLHFASRNMGVRQRLALIFEGKASGAYMTSYATHTLVERKSNIQDMLVYGWLSFSFCTVFLLHELVELFESGWPYFSQSLLLGLETRTQIQLNR